MISRASVEFVRISPRKVRYVIDLIRAKSVPQAQAILNGSPRRAGDIVRKLLNQAVDAAEKNSQVAAGNLVVSKVLADGGSSMKRFRAASMGRASSFKKRTSHIQIELDLAKKVQSAHPVSPRRQGGAKATEAPAPKKKSAKATNKKTVGAK
jgi:large subunit ribosomal protein L22